MEDLLKKELETLSSNLDKKLNDFAAKWESLDGDRTAQKEVVADVKKTFGEFQETNKKMQEQMDAIDLKLQKGSFGEKKSRLTQITEHLKSNEAFAEIKNGNKKSHVFSELGDIMSVKADDMTQANSFESTSVVRPDYVPGIFYNPDTMFRARNLMPQGVTSSNVVPVIREYAYSDGTAVKAGGAEYGQSDFDLKRHDATVYKITAYMILSEEMLEDVDGLSSYIYSRLPSKLGLEENNQILFGSGNSEISGLATNSTAYTDSLADANVTLIDVLASAATQVKSNEYTPSAILLNHSDVTTYLTLKKDSTNNYLAPWVFTGQSPTIAGVPVIETTAITAGTFFVGDFARAAQVFDRRQNTVEISNQNEDNFIKGMLTVRAAERIALAIYRPSAFVYGSIAAALANGSA